MLSPNTLLNKGRYRVDAFIRSTAEWTIYSTVDQVSSESVITIEYPAGARSSIRTAHDGLMRTVDSFPMNGRYVEVTEPVAAVTVGQPLRSVWDRFAVILMALNSLSAAGNAPVEISPETLTRAKDGRLKVLPLSASTGPFDLENWYIPLEVLWRDLDHISQKAIYNSWDVTAVDALEHSADESSAIYSLAALFYREITGNAPIGAFERTVVELDGSDPLKKPAVLVPELGSEASDFLLRCMSLRRKERFSSFEEAVMNFPSLMELPLVTEEDINDLLEVMPSSKPAPAVPRSTSPASEPLASVVNTLETAAISDETFSEETKIKSSPAATELPAQAAEPSLPAELPSPVPMMAASRAVEDDGPIFSAAGPNRKSSGGVKLAIAAVAIAIVGGGGWGIYQYSASTTSIATPAVPVAASMAPAAPVSSAETAPTPSGPSTQTAATTVTDITETPSQSETTSDVAPRASGRPAVKPTAAAKPTPAQTAKKKVTVDDLINDN